MMSNVNVLINSHIKRTKSIRHSWVFPLHEIPSVENEKMIQENRFLCFWRFQRLMIDFYILNVHHIIISLELLWHVCNIAFHAFDDPEEEEKKKRE